MLKKDNQVHNLIMEQIKDVEECLIKFESFMRAATTETTASETLRSLSIDVASKENSADVSLRRMIDSLAGGSYLPSTRSDLIDIATSCDRVANKCEHIATMMVLQQFRFPEEYNEDIKVILETTRKQFEILEKSISTLFARFGELLKNHAILDDIRALESNIDAIEQKLYEKIFALDIGLAERTQTAQFVEALCDISDIIENIADKIQIMLITRKA